jgi:chemotaxis protein MotD
VSAAQALTSGPVTTSPSARSSSSGSRGERSDTSFRDTLETVSRPAAGDGERGRISSDGAHEDKGERDDGAPRGETGVPRAEPASAAELSAMLAALGIGPDGQSAEADFVVAGDATSAATGAETPEAGLGLPGQVDGSEETVEAARLLALLKPGTANAADRPAETVDIKVTVAGQETHLALDQVSAEARASLAAAQDAAAQSADGKDKAATLSAALSQATDDAAKSAARQRGDSEVASDSKPGSGLAARAVTTAEAWGGRGSAALADQGIAGQEGGRSDGRGSSGPGSQQQGAGAFMAALANPQAAGAVREAAGAGAPAEPVSEQIAAEVRAELKADGLGETSSEGVVKVLSLELKPANLGSVTVRIALKDNAVMVHIEAQRPETLAIIERDREALAGALASAGYSVDGITAAPQGDMVRSLGGTLGGLGNSGSPAPQGGPSGQPGQGQAPSHSPGGQGGSGQAGSGHSPYRHPSDDKDANVGSVRRGVDGLYV